LRQALYILMTFALVAAPALAAESPGQLLERLDAYPHAVRINYSVEEVIDYEVGVGSIKKVRGVWKLDESQRLSGTLHRYTWQIIDGFTSQEVLEEAVGVLADAERLYSCDGRACGQGVQWANRIFHERLLYGRDDLQRYRVFGAEQRWRVLLFSAARSADRQYLHAEWLEIAP
jgi:hypothetical protein